MFAARTVNRQQLHLQDLAPPQKNKQNNNKTTTTTNISNKTNNPDTPKVLGAWGLGLAMLFCCAGTGFFSLIPQIQS